MRVRRIRRAGRAVAALLALSATLLMGAPTANADDARLFEVLVFTAVADPARAHAVTPHAADMIEIMGRRYDFGVDVTDDPADLSLDNLNRYDVVLWLNNTGSVLNADQRAAFQSWVRDGGGYVGVHAAASAEPDWAFYRLLVGGMPISGEGAGTFEQTFSVTGDGSELPGMPNSLQLTDELYRFDVDPAAEYGATIVLQANDPDGGESLPIAWHRPIDAGRGFYTALGHAFDDYSDGDFMSMLRSGLWWAADESATQFIRSDEAAPELPYQLVFGVLVIAVAVGGGIAVSRLSRGPVVRRAD